MKSLKGQGLDLSRSIAPLLREDLIYSPSAASAESRDQNLPESKALIMALADHVSRARQDYCTELVDRRNIFSCR